MNPPDLGLHVPPPSRPPPPPQYTIPGQAKKALTPVALAFGLALFKLLPSRAVTRAVVFVADKVIAANPQQYFAFEFFKNLFPPVEEGIEVAKETVGFQPKVLPPSGIVSPRNLGEYIGSIGQSINDLTFELIEDVAAAELLARQLARQTLTLAYEEFHEWQDRAFGQQGFPNPRYAGTQAAVGGIQPTVDALAAQQAKLDELNADPLFRQWLAGALAQNIGIATADFLAHLELANGYDPRVGFVTSIRNETADP